MKKYSAVIGASFLMATSAIGPGFITQTTLFTRELMASFGFVILISILLDIAAQMNLWRIISMAGKRGQEIANDQLKGSGLLLAVLIFFGGLAFNIGNIAGAGLGADIIAGLDANPEYPFWGCIVSAAIALVIFWVKEAGKAMDWFAKVLGILMLLLTAYVAYQSHPPLQEALKQTFFPQKTSVLASITIVGGTVGGYISFAGAHRLLDAGIIGKEHLRAVNRGSVQGILLASLMRVLLFLAALGVVYTGVQLEVSNPAASVFKIATGNIGHYLFGWVLWSAAITSVVGSAYTSVSFIQTFHPLIEKHRRWVITGFILISTLIFTLVGKPVKLLVLAGALNGLILPVSLALMLMAASKKEYLQNYHHPLLLKLAGWMVVAIMSFLGIKLLLTELPRLWN